MPIEYKHLLDKPFLLRKCTICDQSLKHLFLRGLVQSDWRKFFGLKYCAVICGHCKNIIGWERP